MLAAMSTTEDEQEARAYWRFRRLTSRALVAFVVAATGLIVFRTPLAWGDGKLATLVFRGCVLCAPLTGLLAFRWNAKTAELSGYFRGKHGCAPPRA